MNAKAVIAAVVVVIVVVVAAVFLLGGGLSNDDDYQAPELRTDLHPGDFITFERNEISMDGVETITETYTITAINGDTLTVSTNTDGIVTTSTMTSEEFLENIIVDDELNTLGLQKGETEILDTKWGEVRCDVWSGTVLVDVSVWICPENNVAFRITGEAGILGSMNQNLVDTSLFEPYESPSTPPEQTVTVDLRDDLRVGDYVTINVWESGSSNGETYRTDDYETATISAVNGNELTVTISMQDSYPHDTTQTTEEYLATIVPSSDTLANLTLERQETITTSWGDVLCNVYTMTSPNTGGFDKHPTATYWIDPSSGIAFKIVMSVDDAMSGEVHLDHWELGMTVLSSNLIS